MKHTPKKDAKSSKNVLGQMVGLRLTQDEYHQLQRYAAADNRSMASFSRWLVQGVLDELAAAEESGMDALDAIAAMKKKRSGQ